MNNLFSDRIKKTMQLSREEAARIGHNYIGTEHLLLGIIRESEDAPEDVLRELGLNRAEVREAVEELVASAPSDASEKDRPFTPRAKAMLEAAFEEARGMNSQVVDIRHLLLALIKVEEGVASIILSDFGVTYETARVTLGGKPRTLTLKPPRGVLFDLGDTVLRQSNYDLESGLAHLLGFADNPKGFTIDTVLERAKMLEKELFPRRNKSLIEFSRQSFHRLLFEPLDIRFSCSPQELEFEFWKASREMSPDPGLDAVLDALDQRGIPAGIVSNSFFSSQTLSWGLEQHGLKERFRFLMSSSDYGVCKPHAFLFQTAVTRLGLRPEEVWFVGDSHAHDIVGAINTGLGAVLYTNKTGELPDVAPQPHAVVRGWKAFLALLP